MCVPFIDRRLERRPWRRPFAVGIFLLILACFVGMGLMSVRDDRRDPSIAKQVAKQREDTEHFMREPFEPEAAASSGSASAVNVAIADPLAAAGKKVYESESCDACHGENGVGTNAGPKLAGATAQKSAEELIKSSATSHGEDDRRRDEAGRCVRRGLESACRLY